MRQQVAQRLRSPFAGPTVGALVGQGLLAVSMLLVARVYEPTEIASFAVCLALAQPLSIVLTGRLEQVLPRLDEARRWGVITRSAGVGIVVVLVGLVGLSLPGAELRGVGGAAMVAALAASTSLFSVATMVVISCGSFSSLGWMKLVNAGVTAVGQAAVGIWSPTLETLVVTYALGSLAGSALAVRDCWRLRGRYCGAWTFDEDGGPRRFVGTVGGAALLSNTALSIPTLLLGWLYEPIYLASYFLIRRLFILPTQLVAASVSEVSYGLVAQQPVAEIRRRTLAWLSRLRLAALGLVAVAVLIAPMAHLLLGEEYVHLAALSLLLGVTAAAQLLATSLSNILLALRAEHVRLLWNVARMVLLLAVSAVLAVWLPPFVTSIVVLTGVQVVLYAALLILTLRRTRFGASAA